MTTLRIYQPHLLDVIQPDNSAIPGQVVAVVHGDRVEAGIATPDGKTKLGIVSVLSLVPVPKSLKYDPQTGFTSESTQRLC